ncbi:Beta carbonic anhydrase 3, partial [Cucurbita argyrosperma subsp. sororia]
MAEASYEEAIAGLKKLLSEKAEFQETAAAKIRQITAELVAITAGSTHFDPVDRIRTGFTHFKKSKFDDFIENWVKICTPAKTKTQTNCTDMSFEDKCTNCEKEAVNVSLGNLLSYPFVRESVVNNKLFVRGAHYNFVSGAFELWNLDFKLTPSLVV